MPVLSKNRRRVGLDERFIRGAKLLTDTNQTADHLTRRLLQIIQHNYSEACMIEQTYVIKFDESFCIKSDSKSANELFKVRLLGEPRSHPTLALQWMPV
jgi:hypothetical protein